MRNELASDANGGGRARATPSLALLPLVYHAPAALLPPTTANCRSHAVKEEREKRKNVALVVYNTPDFLRGRKLRVELYR